MDHPLLTSTRRLRTAQRLLTLLVAVLATLAATVSASWSSSRINVPPAAETRVGVAAIPAPVFVGLRPSVPAGQVGEKCPRFLQTVVGSCVATKGAAGVADDAATVFRKDTSHIFRDARGHLPTDTPGNRQLIKSAVDPANLRSTTRLPDGSTLTKYFKTLPDGTQVWAEVRNGTTITNGGLNATPR